MRPTVEEQLHGVDRLLDALAADPELGDDSAALVVAIRKQLQRLAGSLAARPTFLRWDNASMAALLHDLAPSLSDDLRQVIADACKPADAPDVDARNNELRAMLTIVIAALPDDDAGDQAWLSIADHLRARAAANPALHKHPQRPAMPASAPRATDKAVT